MAGKRKAARDVDASSNSAKKRKPGPSVVLADTPAPTSDSKTQESGDLDIAEPKKYIFKDPNFLHSNKPQTTGRKGRSWKNLKQIIQMERSLSWKPEHPLYSRIDAPPSFTPAKKYSDLSGLPSLYTDPMTKLRYSSAEEYSRASKLPSDIVAGLLQLRKANTSVP